MAVAQLTSPIEDIPVDFLADPDGRWEYDGLARVAGFDPAWGRLSIGALTEPYSGFPEGAAVVVLTTADHWAIALVDCLRIDCIQGEEVPSARRQTVQGRPERRREDVAA